MPFYSPPGRGIGSVVVFMGAVLTQLFIESYKFKSCLKLTFNHFICQMFLLAEIGHLYMTT